MASCVQDGAESRTAIAVFAFTLNIFLDKVSVNRFCVSFEEGYHSGQWYYAEIFRLISEGLLERETVSENTKVIQQLVNFWAIKNIVSLRAGRSRDRIPVGAKFSVPFQTGPETHKASCRPQRGFLSLSRGKVVAKCCRPLSTAKVASTLEL